MLFTESMRIIVGMFDARELHALTDVQKHVETSRTDIENGLLCHQTGIQNITREVISQWVVQSNNYLFGKSRERDKSLKGRRCLYK